MSSNKFENYITRKKSVATEETTSYYVKLEELYNNKLWHQVTLHLLEMVQLPELKKGDELIQLYNDCISELENRINPLSLAQLAGAIITQHEKPEDSITFVEKIKPKVVDHNEATVLCNVLIAQTTLRQMNDITRTKKILEETETLLDDVDGVTPVHGRFYELKSELHCIVGEHADYYRSALRFLGCTDYMEMDDDKKQKQAFYLGLAALLGHGIYNFGELLAHPILESLKGTTFEWLNDLLFVFNEGNISKFETMKPQWSTQPDLVAKETQLREKIRLLCLMEMTFKRKAWDRQLTFEEIATQTGLEENHVEVMVMRALSLGLVKGTIDQVDSKVNITWVQPRVLDKKQLASMMERLSDWCRDVNGMQKLLEEQANPILTL